MNSLASRKTHLSFVTDDRVFDRGRNRRVVVDATPVAAELRLEGERKRGALHISWAALYEHARLMTRLAERNRIRTQQETMLRRDGGAR